MTAIAHRQKRYFAMLGALLCLTPTAHAAPSRGELMQMLVTIDDHQRTAGDFRSETYIEQKQRGKVTVVYEAQTYRQASSDRVLILFTSPKGLQGQGYLHVDKILWFYDPAVKKWERRTERERIGGTNSRRLDFEESHLARDYDPEYLHDQKLGVYDTMVLKLKGKAGREPVFPLIKIWVDRDTTNVLKREEYALSGKLLRTCYYPKWNKLRSESKGADVWYPQEVRLYDEVEKESSTILLVKLVDLGTITGNIFTKAWLESVSR